MIKTDNEELCLRFEVSQLRHKMITQHDGTRSIEGISLFGVQMKMDLAFAIGEGRQAK